jgi:hypothetical protein
VESHIKIGDTVMVVNGIPCCGGRSGLGDIFVVDWLGVADGECHDCGDDSPMLSASADSQNDYFTCYPVSCLTKIDPLAQGETKEAYKNLRVPA